MTTDTISEIGIDNQERLFIRPTNEKFPLIYRTANEVHWHTDDKFLYAPKPREWTYVDWYEHILSIIRIEANCNLKLSQRTRWTNIPDDLKMNILNTNNSFENEHNTVSWIFLSIALSSQGHPATVTEISTAADYVNHAIPTHKELQYSIKWLTSNNLISKESDKYRLTDKGQKEFERASANTKILLNIWKNLEQRMKKNRA